MDQYSTGAQGGGRTGGGGDADRMRTMQTKMHLENRLRILKNDVLDKERIFHEFERDIRALEMEVHHIGEDEKRLSEELRRMSIAVKTGVGASKQSEMGLRETDQALTRKHDEMHKLEREIDVIKLQITEKQNAMADIKQEVSKLMKEKEDYRRAHELEHFSVKSEGEHVHDREVRLTLLSQDKKRKETELEHKNQKLHELRRDINFKDQDIMQIEAELTRINSGH